MTYFYQQEKCSRSPASCIAKLILTKCIFSNCDLDLKSIGIVNVPNLSIFINFIEINQGVLKLCCRNQMWNDRLKYGYVDSKVPRFYNKLNSTRELYVVSIQCDINLLILHVCILYVNDYVLIR